MSAYCFSGFDSGSSDPLKKKKQKMQHKLSEKMILEWRNYCRPQQGFI